MDNETDHIQQFHDQGNHSLCDPMGDCPVVEGIVMQMLDDNGDWVDYARGNRQTVARHIEQNAPGQWRGKHWTTGEVVLPPTVARVEPEPERISVNEDDVPRQDDHEYDPATCNSRCQHIRMSVEHLDGEPRHTIGIYVNEREALRIGAPWQASDLADALMQAATSLAVRQIGDIGGSLSPEELAIMVEAAAEAGISIVPIPLPTVDEEDQS